MSTDLIEAEAHPIATRHESTELSVEIVLNRLEKIQELMRRAMIQGVDYGIIPGTSSKPTLLKPGAEKLAVMFRMAPKYRTQKTFHDDSHLTVESTCQIYDLAENFLGESSAMCSTREAKYAYRKSERVCPACGKPAIIKGKAEYGGGWLCWPKKGGCNAKFADDATEITSQQTGRVANEDLADSYNTVLRIAEKRAFIAAMRLVTGSSALFDEEGPGHGEQEKPVEHVKDTWLDWITSKPSLAQVNEFLPRIKSIKDKAERAHAWTLTADYAKAKGWELDAKAKQFKENEEPEQEEMLQSWRTWLASGPTSDTFTKGIRDDFGSVPEKFRPAVQALLDDFAMKNGYERDADGNYRVGGQS